MKQNHHFIPAKSSTRKVCNLQDGKSNKRKPCCNMYEPESIGSNLYFPGSSHTLQGTVQGKWGKLIMGEMQRNLIFVSHLSCGQISRRQDEKSPVRNIFVDLDTTPVFARSLSVWAF